MKSVLSVGQCVPDHHAISQMLISRFDVEIQTAAVASEALEKMRATRFDLVLVNRKLDADYTDGSEIIQAMQADDALAGVPVMLITNYPEHDEAAVKLGAVSGFGKASLSDARTIEKLAELLA